MKTARGFTLIELVVSVAIMAILSSFSFTGLINLIDVIAAYPSEIAVRQAAYAMMDELMYGSYLNFSDGLTQRDGIRYANSVIDADGDSIKIKIGGPYNPVLYSDPWVYRGFGTGSYVKINSGISTTSPKAARANITVTGNGTGGAIFTYCDANGAITDNVLLIRRVDIDMTVTLGDRSYRSSSSVTIKDVNST